MTVEDAGRIAADTLLGHHIDTVFTLNGAHLWPLYYGCRDAGVRLIDTRHEQAAAFAAEGWAKLTRGAGVAALTAGPGVTNAISALTTAYFNGSPLLVIGGRAPQMRWGSGSLQEIDHLPIVAPVTKRAMTVTAAEQMAPALDELLGLAGTAHRGPVFADVPLDAWGSAEHTPRQPFAGADDRLDDDALTAVVTALAEARHPVLMLGSDVYWARAEAEARAFAEAARIPVVMNDMARGLIPADHELAFSRARSAAFNGADLVMVAGTPLDFRVGFGDFGAARVIHLADSPEGIATHVELAASAAGPLTTCFQGLLDRLRLDDGVRDDREAWIARLRDEESARRAKDEARLTSAADPIDPMRIMGEVRARLDRDAVVVGDGGDFVSYAGRHLDTYTPGCFMSPGPYGCLGVGMGYALAAALAFPQRQVVALFGDGALGMGLAELDTLARHGARVTAIVGNNSGWGLEKQPMRMLYGESLVADLAAGTRYDLAAEALGVHGELVRSPGELGPALDRALAHDGPSLVNVLTDPDDAYPRQSVLL